MKQKIILLAYALLVLLKSGCSSSLTDEFNILTHKDAYGISTFKLEGGGDQHVFKVNLTYPEFAINAKQYDALVQRGWEACSDLNDQWYSFVDKDYKPKAQCVFSKKIYFKKHQNLMMVILTYNSNLVGESCPAEPDSQIQDAFIMVYEGMGKKQLERLRIVCE